MKELKIANKDDQDRVALIQQRFTVAASNSSSNKDNEMIEDMEALKFELDSLTTAIKERTVRIDDINTRRAWNAENICQIKEEKTIVNKKEAASLKAEDYVVPEGTVATNSSASSSRGSGNSNSETQKPHEEVLVANEEVKSTGLKTSTSTTTSKPKPSTTTISKEVTKPVGPVTSTASEDVNFSIISYNDFATKYEDILEKYSEIDSMDKTKDTLLQKCDILLHDHAQNYLLLSCLEDEMNGKTKRMKGVCRQSQILSHISELGKSMSRDPRDVIVPFFLRLQDKQHFEGFAEQVQDFIKRIQDRAVVKKKEMDMERMAIDEQEVELGPGGLNPVTVMMNLPQELRDAFESQDIAQLQGVLQSMDPAIAKKHMKDCVDSGLWVPSPESSAIFDSSEN